MAQGTKLAKWLLGLLIISSLAGFGVFFLFRKPPDEKTPHSEKKRPRLAVLVVFDQMRGDYLGRWQDLYGPGGFKRLQSEGAWFVNCHYPYASTSTAVGHASMSTGAWPRDHGIIENSWYDRPSGKEIVAVESDRHLPVPADPGEKKPKPGAAPIRRRGDTIGDLLLQATKGKGKVVSLSIKDRSAAFLAALKAIVYWFSTSLGEFVTSTYYTDRPHSWVKDFNRLKLADQYFDKSWQHLRPEVNYARHSDIDDQPWEGSGYEQGRIFPHPFRAGLKAVGPAYYKAVVNSPMGNDLLLELAKKAIVAEKLGQDDEPDLLCLSFSCTDTVGHCWGPDSQEVLDVTLRADAVVQELLTFLDTTIGKDQYLLVLSADHGVCPIPEVAQQKGIKAGRIPPSLLSTKAAEYLNQHYGTEKLPWVEFALDYSLYFNRGVLRERQLPGSEVEKVLADWLVKQEGVQAAFTRTQMAASAAPGDSFGDMAWRSFDADRSGDILVVLHPYHELSSPLKPKEKGTYRASHGTPHPYDTHVPLLVFGPQVQAGVRQDRTSPLAMAAILAEGLGLSAPETFREKVPHGLWK